MQSSVCLKNPITVLLILGCLLVPAGAQNASTPGQAQKAPNAAPAPDAESRKARALLQKMIEALGGQDYLTYASRSEQGRRYSFDRGQAKGTGIEYWLFWQYPDKVRIELDKKREVKNIFNGDQGYEITYKGTAALPDKQVQDYVRQHHYSMEAVLREWLKEPQTLVFYAGPAVIENRQAERVTLLNAKDESVTIAIDAGNYLPLRKSFTYRDPLDHLKTEEVDTYDKYRRDQGGMMAPHFIEHTRNGEVISQRYVSKVEYNPPLSSSMFEAKVSYGPNNLGGKR
jgi:hypothetical protein